MGVTAHQGSAQHHKQEERGREKAWIMEGKERTGGINMKDWLRGENK